MLPTHKAQITTGQVANRLDETAATICREIRALIAKGNSAGEEFYKAAGQRIGELKGLYPGKWLMLVRQECGVNRSRAFELLAIGTGKKTLEGIRAETAARVRRHAGRRPLANGRTSAAETPAVVRGTVSASSDDAAIGTFIEGLGDRFFKALQHAPAQQAKITQRILALHDRKMVSRNPALKATGTGTGATTDARTTTDFAAAMAKAEFAEAKRKGTKPRSSKRIDFKPPKLDKTILPRALGLGTGSEAPTKH